MPQLGKYGSMYFLNDRQTHSRNPMLEVVLNLAETSRLGLSPEAIFEYVYGKCSDPEGDVYCRRHHIDAVQAHYWITFNLQRSEDPDILLDKKSQEFIAKLSELEKVGS